MTRIGNTLPGFLLLALACAPAAETPPPVLDLQPIPALVSLEDLDLPVQAQYRERRGTLEALLAKEGAPVAELATAYGELGMFHHAYKALDLAGLCYENAAVLAPQEPRWLYYLADVHHAAGEVAASRRAFEEYLGRRPGNPPALVRLAELELDAGAAAAARSRFETAVTADPANARALAGLGRTALAERDFEAAARHLEAALAIGEGADLVHHSLGLAYRGLGDLDAARTHLGHGGAGNRDKTAAGMRDPLMVAVLRLRQGTTAHLEEGQRAYREDRAEDAVAATRRAVAANPDDPVAQLNLGASLLRASRPEEAMAAFERALEISPNHPKAHFSLGAVLASLGRSDQAEGHYLAAVASDPGHREAHFNLANLLRARGEPSQALEHYQRVVEIDPRLSHGRLWRAVCRLRLGRQDEALRGLARDLEELPGAALLRTLEARLPATLADPAYLDGRRALESAEALYRDEGSLGAAEAVAAAHAELGGFAAAQAWQEAALAAARAAGEIPALGRLERRLALYRRSEPCRETWADDELAGGSLRVIGLSLEPHRGAGENP